MATESNSHRRDLRRRVRRVLAKRVGDQHPSTELSIVPFLDIVVNLMVFLLATTTAVVAVAQVDTSLPGTCSGRVGCAGVPIQLRLHVGQEGYRLASDRGWVDSSCRRVDASPSLTIPVSAGGTQALNRLDRCLGVLSSQFPEARRVNVSADPDIEYEDLVEAMDVVLVHFEGFRIAAGLRGR